MMKFALPLLAAAAMFAAPADATVTIVGAGGSSTILTSGGAGTTISFNGQENGVSYAGLSSALTLSLASQTASSYTFNYTMTNTSTSFSRVVSFGFDAAPNITPANITSTGVFSNSSSGSISNSFTVENCVTAGPNCAGGGGGGVVPGTPGSGTFVLNFGAATPNVTLSAFIDRYQASILTPGGSGVGLPVRSPVPEPATWAMMLVGFGAVGVSLRRRKRVTLQAA